MKNLFDEAVVADTIGRMERLTPASERRWGKMTAAQALAHGSVAMEMAVGDRRPKRLMIGWVLGPVSRGSRWVRSRWRRIVRRTRLLW